MRLGDYGSRAPTMIKRIEPWGCSAIHRAAWKRFIVRRRRLEPVGEAPSTSSSGGRFGMAFLPGRFALLAD
jgi:hypothetical protein